MSALRRRDHREVVASDKILRARRRGYLRCRSEHPMALSRLGVFVTWRRPYDQDCRVADVGAGCERHRVQVWASAVIRAVEEVAMQSAYDLRELSLTRLAEARRAFLQAALPHRLRRASFLSDHRAVFERLLP